MPLALLSLLEVPDSVANLVLKAKEREVKYLIRIGGLDTVMGYNHPRLLKAMAIFLLLSSGDLTRWDYANNSYRGKQYYLPDMLPTLGKRRGYDCDEFAQVLLRAMRDNGYRAYFYVPFPVHMAIMVEIDGRWVEFDPSLIEYPPVRVLEGEPYFVPLGDSVGYRDEGTYKTQVLIDRRYVRKVIPLLYRKAMSNPKNGRKHFRRYLEEVRGRL